MSTDSTTSPMRHPKRFWKVQRLQQQQQHKKGVTANTTDTELVGHVMDYLRWVAEDQPHCKNVLRGGSVLLQCSCLAEHLRHEPTCQAVAQYLVPFVQLSRLEQKQVLTQRIQQSTQVLVNNLHDPAEQHREHCRFELPVLWKTTFEEDETSNNPKPIMVCSSALLTILGLSRHVWAHCLKCATDDSKAVEDKIMSQTGSLKSNSGNALDEHIAQALRVFFEAEMARSKSIGGKNTTATAYYSCQGGVTTKKALFEKFCQQRGYELVKSEEGILRTTPVRRRLSTPQKEGTVESSSEEQTICSLSSFLAYWKKNYPNLTVAGTNGRRASISSLESLASALCNKSGKVGMENPQAMVRSPQQARTAVRSSTTTTTGTALTPFCNANPSRTAISETTNLPFFAPPSTAATTHSRDNHEALQYQQLVAESEVLRASLNYEKLRLQSVQHHLMEKSNEIGKLQTENDHLQAAVGLYQVNQNTHYHNPNNNSSINNTPAAAAAPAPDWKLLLDLKTRESMQLKVENERLRATLQHLVTATPATRDNNTGTSRNNIHEEELVDKDNLLRKRPLPVKNTTTSASPMPPAKKLKPTE